MRVRRVVVVVLLLAGCGSTPAENRQAEPAGTRTTPPSTWRPCPREGAHAIDYVPFVQIDGRSFQAALAGPDRVPDHLLGPVVMKVRCRLSDQTGPGYRYQDGDASFLEPGTPVRAIVGHRPQLRLAVPRQGGGWELYEARDVPNARRGADSLDLGEVRRISLMDGDTAQRRVRSITDLVQVRRIVAAVNAAATLAPDHPVVDRLGQEGSVFVRFDFADGISVQRPWWRKAGVFDTYLWAPDELRSALG